MHSLLFSFSMVARSTQRLSGSLLLPQATRAAASRPMPPRATLPERMRRRVVLLLLLSSMPSMADRLERVGEAMESGRPNPLITSMT